MNRPRMTLLAVLAATVLVANACGTTEETGDDPAPTGEAGGPVELTDSRGETVTLDEPAQRVVGLEWGEVEMLVSLGVMPVGVADPDGYATWVRAAPLAEDVTDVGLRGEPSVDSIVALEPDLVVMEAERGSSLVTQLEEYVPVLVTTGTDTSDNLGRMRQDLQLIAAAVGKEAEAEDLLAELDSSLADGRERLEQAGAGGAPFTMADGWQQGGSVSIRMFTEGSLISDLGTELGLRNAWGGPVDDDQWGLTTTDVEGLTRIEDPEQVRFLYNASDQEDVFADGLADNQIWTSFPFVEQGQVHKLPEGIWTFGGPRSCQQFIDAILQVYEA